jgi:hypothetical protein
VLGHTVSVEFQCEPDASDRLGLEPPLLGEEFEIESSLVDKTG